MLPVELADMSESRILFCRCSRAAIISGPLMERVLAALGQAGCQVMLRPQVYNDVRTNQQILICP